MIIFPDDYDSVVLRMAASAAARLAAEGAGGGRGGRSDELAPPTPGWRDNSLQEGQTIGIGQVCEVETEVGREFRAKPLDARVAIGRRLLGWEHDARSFASETGTFATLAGDGGLFSAGYNDTDVTLTAI